jgi:hypothetical protein
MILPSPILPGDPAAANSDRVPILFVHYGYAGFLRIVLSRALQSNPGKAVYFLGDESNRKLVPSGVRFRPIANYRKGALLESFRKVFVPMAGRTHHFNKAGGVETWLRFVFERWFVILEFLREESIGPFWIFDSDTLIAGDLEVREPRFAGFDATEQCVGGCLNGYVSSPDIVEGYCRKMTTLFTRPGYLESHQERLKQHSGLAFNEMDAWQTHRDEEKIRTVALGRPTGGEAFDDALGITEGWKTAPAKVRGRIPVKHLARDSRGGFFAFPADGSEPVRLVTLNLSWLPDYVYRKLAPGCLPVGGLPYDHTCCRAVNFGEPLRDRVIRRGEELLWRLRNSRNSSKK